jgi:hypothetical protein
MQPLQNPALCSSTGKIRLAVFVNDEVLLQYLMISDGIINQEYSLTITTSQCRLLFILFFQTG